MNLNDPAVTLTATVTSTGDGGITVSTTGVTTSPASLDLSIPQGRDWSLYVTWKKNDMPVNLSGGTAQFVARTVQGGTALLDLSSGSGITLGATYAKISRTAAQTSALSFVRARYNYNVTVAGTVIPLLEGFVDLEKSVMA